MSFWAGRRVLLTGHTGFKGAWLALWLHDLGADVTGFAGPPPSDPNLFELASVAQCVRDLRGDVRDPGAVRQAVVRSRPEVVFHLAAQALVRPSYEEPVATWDTNVMGTLHLLEAIRTAAPEASILVATSDKCYANDGSGRAFSEEDPLGGSDPYSASKAAQELVAASHRDAYGLRIATARAGNVIGGGDWARDRLVPDFVRAASKGVPLSVRSPRAIRPWQHVLAALHGYLCLAERLAEVGDCAEPWNFGPPHDDNVPVMSVMERLRSAWPQPIQLAARSPARAPEPRPLRLNSTKARDRLGWSPGISLATAIEATARWHLEVAAGASPRHVSLEQLHRLGRLATNPERKAADG